MNGSIFHVIMAVWGDEFIDLFLTTAIPNQLSAGNLGALPEGSRYRIFTSAEDRARLERADAVRALESVLPVDIVEMDSDGRDLSKYDREIRYHRRGVEDALRCGAAYIFLAPDHVLATHTMARLVALRAEGYRAVVCPGIRLSREPMLAALAEYGVSDLPPRTLVRMALQHLHPFTWEHMADARDFSRFPTFVYWRVNGSGLLARCLNLHALMIDPARPLLPKSAPDGRYLSRSVPDLSMVYVVTDSDDLVLFEMTPRDVVSRGRRSWPKVWRTAAVARRCDAHQLAYWRQPIRFHWNDLGSAWAPIEVESARFAARVLDRVPYVRRLFPLLNGIRRWQQRYDRRAREWRRRLPRIRLKQIKRPVVIAMSRAKKRLRRALR